MSDLNTPELEPSPIEEPLTRFRAYVTGLSGAKAKSKLISGAVIALLLAAASSVLFYMDIATAWLPGLVGSPAGVILFLIGLGWVYRHPEHADKPVMNWRVEKSWKQRFIIALIVLFVFVVVFVPFSTLIPYGIGGTLFVVTFLSGVVFLRRTPEELALALQGLPDPRDLDPAGADEYADVDVEDEDDDVSGGRIGGGRLGS